MSHRFPVALALVLGTLAASQPAADTRPFPPAARLDVLVDGDSRPQYAARGTRYIEAIKGRSYSIRLTNPYPVRVAVALSVDGLNSIDSRHTTAASARKWVIEPFGTITISGWQTSLSDARRFEFTTEARSYGARLGRTEDLGIISAVFFRERPRRPLPVTAWDETMPAAGAPPTRDTRSAPGAPGAGKVSAGAAAAASSVAESTEYAATGMGGHIDHQVTVTSLDLEDTPAASLSLRYEFRPELVRLGVLPVPGPNEDAMDRRERAHGFVPGFCPEPKK